MTAPVQVTRLVLKDGTEISPNLYIQHTSNGSLYKVSTPEPQGDRPGTTAVVCLDNGTPLARTTVRRISAGALAQVWKPASAQIIRKYHDYLDGTGDWAADADEADAREGQQTAWEIIDGGNS